METVGKGVIKYGGVVAAILAVGAIMIGITHEFAIEFSSFAWFIAYAGISFGLYSVADNIFLKNFNTAVELKNGNVAYALVLLGFAVIIAACVGAA